jgi:hypothetical protein
MGTVKHLTTTLLVLGLLTLGSHGKAFAEPSSSPDKTEVPNPGLWLVNLYREYISPIDGDRCPSLPTCSSYSVQAIKKHGFFIGWMMTVDRLIHEGQEETKVSPVVYYEGKWRILDPVESNDFWWYHPVAKKGTSNEPIP